MGQGEIMNQPYQQASADIRHANHFNFFRLCFAALVIVSHSFELVDGDRSRELLTRVFGTISFGEFAVDGFFLLSGYLIMQSWQMQPRLLPFLWKRFLRIFPAFIVCSIICALLFGPLGAPSRRGYWAAFDLSNFFTAMMTLGCVEVPRVFAGSYYPMLNGAMWTIRYEMLCYLTVAAAGLLWVFRRPVIWLAGCVTLIALIVCFYPGTHRVYYLTPIIYLSEDALVRLTMMFMVGGCFYVFRKRIPYRPKFAVLALILSVICLFNEVWAEIGLAVFGGYLLFYLAYARIPVLERFQRLPDLSYGIYLYGWPIQKLLIFYVHGISPWLVIPLTIVLAGYFALVSWYVIEKPSLTLKSWSPQPALQRILRLTKQTRA